MRNTYEEREREGERFGGTYEKGGVFGPGVRVKGSEDGVLVFEGADAVCAGEGLLWFCHGCDG